jgi:hypothetical protein
VAEETQHNESEPKPTGTSSTPTGDRPTGPSEYGPANPAYPDEANVTKPPHEQPQTDRPPDGGQPPPAAAERQQQLAREVEDLEEVKERLTQELHELRAQTPEAKEQELRRVERMLADRQVERQRLTGGPAYSEEERRQYLLSHAAVGELKDVLAKRDQAYLERCTDEELRAELAHRGETVP